MTEAEYESRRVDTKEAAAYIGLAVSTLVKMRMRKEGPPYLKITKMRVVYDTADLDAWLTSKRSAV